MPITQRHIHFSIKGINSLILNIFSLVNCYMSAHIPVNRSTIIDFDRLKHDIVLVRAWSIIIVLHTIYIINILVM